MTDPVHDFAVENRVGVSQDPTGTTVVRARHVGLMFHPIQDRGFLVRDVIHPGPDGSPARRTMISPSDLTVPSRLVPFRRSTALTEPSPTRDLERDPDGKPSLMQTLPPLPMPAELRLVIELTGHGGGQGADDVEWSTEEKRDYLKGKYPVEDEAAKAAGWECQSCYDRWRRLNHIPPRAVVNRVTLAAGAAQCSAERHGVGPTRVESGNDSGEFELGMTYMARIHDLAASTYVIPIDIGEDEVPRPGGGNRVMGDVMPLWARVVQMVDAVQRHKRLRPTELLSFVAMASHGWTDGTQLGLSMTPSRHEAAYLYSVLFLRELSTICNPDLTVTIFGCSAGGETNSFGSRSIARWMADQLRAFGVDRPRVDAHTVVAHAWKVPFLRRFEPHVSDGGGGGLWVVPPPSGPRGVHGVGDRAAQQNGELSEARELRRDRLGTYRQRALQQINAAHRRTVVRRHRPATFTPADESELRTLYHDGWALHQNAVALRTPPDAADVAGRAAIQKYRSVIRRYHELLVERGVSSADGMIAAIDATDPDINDLPPATPPIEQAADMTQWRLWQKANHLVLDGLNFCSPMMTLPEIHAYIASLPQNPDRLERDLLDLPSDVPTNQHFWFFSDTYQSPPRSGYLGTVPGAHRARARRRPRQ